MKQKMTGGNGRTLRGVILILAATGCTRAAEIQVDTGSPVPASLQSGIGRSTIQGRYAFTDPIGKHLLLLSRSEDTTKDGTVRISLLATQYRQTGETWKPEWTIKDGISCLDLDSEADFLPALTSFTDLDGDGTVESTVAYRMICAGGIEPKTTKVILRQGATKYAVRGESLVKVPGAPTFGGEYKVDASLDNAPSHKNHLVSIWKKAAGY